MITTLKRWSAWAPEVATEAGWREWAANPVTLPGNGVPPLPEVPAIRRRRLSNLSRMALKVAFACLEGEDGASVNSVFVSHHGEMSIMLELTDAVIVREPLSPKKFSHSVHNTTAGHFSIETANQLPSASVCGGQASFCYGFLEALAMTHRNPENPTLLVMADVPMPDIFAPYSRPPAFPYAFAVLLTNDSAAEGTRLQLDLAPDKCGEEELAFPQALVFLQWLLSGETQLMLHHQQQRWTWKKSST